MKSPLTAVVVDDDQQLREVIKSLLESLDVQVVADASNGVEGVAAYRQHNPSLLLLDFYMPQMDGLQALKAVLAEDAQAIVVMLSSVPGPGDTVIDDCLMAGATDWIRKDLSMEQITTQMEGLLVKHFA
uniref:Two-component response regulator n=1 Tax=Magnetococcus massalia (strain MO-1) TaxID=451514 RepID=A0A1S7LGS4_MAGMO|nr:Two-component response regulator [Candidatus Magnetococcus massalia]